MSFILLGILNSQAQAAAAAGSYELLQTEILSGTQNTITFSSLGDYSTDFQHLQVRYVARDNRPFYLSSIAFIRLNGDTGSNYSSHMLLGNGTTPSVANWTGITAPYTAWSASTNSATDAFGAGVIDILDPFASKNTTWRCLSSAPSDNYVALSSGFWNSTNSVTSISIIQESGHDFIAKSRFSLYGLRKAAA